MGVPQFITSLTAKSFTAKETIGGVMSIISVAGGVAIYRGAVRINLAQFFRWTAALLVLVAAGSSPTGSTTCRRRTS
jgi:high-affinity iron transporter